MVPVAGGLGDPTLKADVWVSILQYENGQSCSDVNGTAIDVVQPPDSKGRVDRELDGECLRHNFGAEGDFYSRSQRRHELRYHLTIDFEG